MGDLAQCYSERGAKCGTVKDLPIFANETFASEMISRNNLHDGSAEIGLCEVVRQASQAQSRVVQLEVGRALPIEAFGSERPAMLRFCTR